MKNLVALYMPLINITHDFSGRGGTGRHARLRIWYRKVWGFDSLRPQGKSVYAGITQW